MKIGWKRSMQATLFPAAISVGAVALGALSQAVAQNSPKLEDSLVFAMPGGPIQEALQVCIANDFTKKTNVRVDILSIQTPQAIAKIVMQRNSPEIDVTWSTDAAEYTGFKQGLFVPITPELVPNLANIDPKYSPQPNKGAMISVSIQGIQYNTQIFKEKNLAPPKSWRDLWDPKYKGHVGIYGLGLGSGQAIVAISGFLNGGNPKNFDAAFEYLAKIKPNLYAIFAQAPQYDAALLKGDVWLSITNAGRPLSLMQQGSPVSFIQPEEGVIANKIALQIVRNAQHPKAAAAFVNWMLSKEAQSCLPVGYPPVIKGIEIAADMAPFMTVQRQIIPLDAEHMQEHLPDLLRRWNKELEQ